MSSGPGKKVNEVKGAGSADPPAVPLVAAAPAAKAAPAAAAACANAELEQYFGFIFDRFQNNERTKRLRASLKALQDDVEIRVLAAEFEKVTVDGRNARIFKRSTFKEEVQEVLEEAEEDFYVHIDALNPEKKEVTSTALNEYMLRMGYFDPRRVGAFPDTLYDKDGDRLPDVSLTTLRNDMGYSDSYYEFWKVYAKTFDPKKIQQWLAINGAIGDVRIMKVINNDHEIILLSV